MRNVLLFIGCLLSCFSLTAQNKESISAGHLFHAQLDSLEKITDSIRIDRLCILMENAIRKVPVPELSTYIIEISEATNASTNPNKYFRLLATAFSTLHEDNYAIKNFEIISKTVSSVAPPAATLLNAILSNWKSLSF